MDALELLIERRAELDRLFQRGGPRVAVLAALDAYLTVKEQILYVALPAAARHLLAAAKHTARMQEAVLHGLLGLDPEDPQLALRIGVLGARFHRLAITEEETLFPCVAVHVEARALDAIGRMIADALADLPLRARVADDVEGPFLSAGA